MSAFEDFVNLELPKRSPLETVITVSYDNDPNLPGAPDALKLAPLGTWFRENTAAKWWRKKGGGATDWEDQTAGGGGGVTIYTTETALLADTPADGTIGYAQDTDRYFFRKNGAWVARGEFVATDTVSAAGTGTASERFGKNTTSTNSGTLAVGYSADATNWRATSIGYASSASNQGTLAVGASANASGLNASAMGAFSRATANNATAYGYSSQCAGSNSAVFGNNCNITGGSFNAVFGYNANGASYSRSTLFGSATAVTGDDGTTLGYDTTAATLAFAAGSLALANASGSLAIGYDTFVSSSYTNAIALGRSAVGTAANRCTVGTISGSYDLELQFGKGLGAWGVTPPSSQPAKINDPTDLASCITAITAIIDVLEGAGLSST